MCVGCRRCHDWRSLARSMISASGVEGRKEGVEVPSCRVRRHRDEARMLSWIETGRMLPSHQRGLMFLSIFTRHPYLDIPSGRKHFYSCPVHPHPDSTPTWSMRFDFRAPSAALSCCAVNVRTCLFGAPLSSFTLTFLMTSQSHS